MSKVDLHKDCVKITPIEFARCGDIISLYEARLLNGEELFPYRYSYLNSIPSMAIHYRTSCIGFVIARNKTFFNRRPYLKVQCVYGIVKIRVGDW